MTAAPQSIIALPQFRAHARPGGCGTVRKSRRGPWRAAVLIGVHVFIILHILHWLWRGQTLTPLEPSEGMQTLKDGLVNAGFVLFVAAIASTLIFGRFFCGWACHVVAYQDLSMWLLKKIGLRPKPFRSRLLIFVPLLAGLYMFIFPLAHRFGIGVGWPHFEAHFMTDEFWVTFPGWGIGAFTFFVCGFLIVYLLGNKGFCTYACPYGGFFGPVDTLSPGKILVTDACEGCGHCTATCTSNVRVHEEVRLYGMVVDPGCMKCLDCIDVCPKDALYFGFGRPSIVKPAARSQPPPPRTFDYSWTEELGLAAFFLVALYAFRGLYDAVPLLLALGISAICAFLLLQAARLLYAPNVRLHAWQFKHGGRLTRGGVAYASLIVLLLALLAHSTYVQYHVREGEYYRDEAQQLQSEGAPATAVQAATRRSITNFEAATAAGLRVTPKVEAALGALYTFQSGESIRTGDQSRFVQQLRDAEAHLRRALAQEPRYALALHKLSEVLALQGKRDEAISQLKAALDIMPDLADAPQNLVDICVAGGRPREAVDTLEGVVRRRPRSAEARLALAAAFAATGDNGRVVNELRRVIADHPDHADAHLRLGLLLADRGELDAAAELLKRATELSPRGANAWYLRGQVALGRNQPQEAAAAMKHARALAPFNREYLRVWALALQQAGGLAAEREALSRASADDTAAQYALVFVQLAAGDQAAAQGQYERVRAVRPDLPPP